MNWLGSFIALFFFFFWVQQTEMLHYINAETQPPPQHSNPASFISQNLWPVWTNSGVISGAVPCRTPLYNSEYSLILILCRSKAPPWDVESKSLGSTGVANAQVLLRESKSTKPGICRDSDVLLGKKREERKEGSSEVFADATTQSFLSSQSI